MAVFFKGHFVALVLACFLCRDAVGLTPLVLSGPCSVIVCPGYPPHTNPNPRPYDRYPQLTFQVTNAPAGFSLLFDVASNVSPPGLGAPSGISAGQNMGINSPTVLSGNDMKVYVSNMNGLAGMSVTNTTGVYGAGNNGALPCGGSSTASVDAQTGVITGTCCQNLRFSVSPGSTGTAYTAGFKDVTVCYANANTCTISFKLAPANPGGLLSLPYVVCANAEPGSDQRLSTFMYSSSFLHLNCIVLLCKVQT